MNKIQSTMETIFSREISYGAFLADKGFTTKKLRVYMLKKHLNRVGRKESIVF
jgi:hypothetical protein